MSIADKIKTFRDLQGLNRAQLADKIGAKREQISAWEAGKYKPGEDNLLKLADFFKVPLTAFYSDEEPNGIAENITPVKNNEGRIPFYDSIAVGGIDLLADQEPVSRPYDMINPGDFLKKATGSLRVYGHSMFPKYPAGCVVAFCAADIDVIIWGEDYVIELSDRRVIKRIEKGDLPGFIKARSYNKSEDYVYADIDIPINKIKRLSTVLGMVILEASV